MQFPDDYPEILADAARHLNGMFLDLGLSAAQAELSAREAVEFLRLNWGGTQVYFAKGVAYAGSLRDEEIWREFNGQNADELARKHELSYRMVMYIVKRMRELERVRRQMTLNLDSSSRAVT